MMRGTMDVREAETKQEVISELLEQGMVLVTLDARVAGVDVPKHLKDDAQLRLNLSYRFGLPMDVDASGVTATLTFAGAPFTCRLPWSAIYLLVSHVTGRPILFPSDVPSEFFPSGSDAPQIADLALSQSSTPRKRPRLTLIPGESSMAEELETVDAAAVPTESPKEPARKNHLRVVK